MTACPFCRGPLAILGALGRLLWFRCVDCGMECSRSPVDIDNDSTEDDSE